MRASTLARRVEGHLNTGVSWQVEQRRTSPHHPNLHPLPILLSALHPLQQLTSAKMNNEYDQTHRSEVTCLWGSKFLPDYYVKSRAHLRLLWDLTGVWAGMPGAQGQRSGDRAGVSARGDGSPLHQARRDPQWGHSLYHHLTSHGLCCIAICRAPTCL